MLPDSLQAQVQQELNLSETIEAMCLSKPYATTKRKDQSALGTVKRRTQLYLRMTKVATCAYIYVHPSKSVLCFFRSAISGSKETQGNLGFHSWERSCEIACCYWFDFVTLHHVALEIPAEKRIYIYMHYMIYALKLHGLASDSLNLLGARCTRDLRAKALAAPGAGEQRSTRPFCCFGMWLLKFACRLRNILLYDLQFFLVWDLGCLNDCLCWWASQSKKRPALHVGLTVHALQDILLFFAYMQSYHIQI